MTRPQKESDMKQEHRVTIRLTDTVFSIIEAFCCMIALAAM